MNAVTQWPGPKGRALNILLVDDSVGDVLLAKQAFSRLTLANEIAVAEDGEMALQMLRREGRFFRQTRPDLILLDLNLPRRDGCEVLSAVKQDENLRDIPVIVLTGSRNEAEIRHTYALHANAYIVKPVNFSLLQEIAKGIAAFWFGLASLPGAIGARG